MLRIVWCGVLGTLRVTRGDGTTLTIAGPARRLLLAALISRVGTTVAADVLIEDLWGAVPPRSAAKTLQSHLVRLRDDLGRAEAERVLLTDPTGYRLALEPGALDTTSFETSLGRAREIREPAAALQAYDDALALWRGDPYEDFPEAAFAVAERVRLGELRSLAEEERTEHALALGQSAELIAGLEKRVAAAPYRERGWEQLMLALYRAGRQADALGAFRRVAALLADELGLDPGAGLRDLQERVLGQDPGLMATPAAAKTSATIPDQDRCPYRGLALYGEADSDLFVGRERMTASIVSMVAEHRVVVVTGASGSGKSSVLRAGLMPALRGGALPGSSAWRVAVATPTEISSAAIGLLDVLILDQAEELFTMLDLVARAAAVDVLEQFVQGGGRLVLGLRGDFYGRLVEVQPLGAYAEAATILAGPLRPDELRRVIVEPAARVGLHPEPELVEAVLDDVGGQATALPLLSAALVRTWENREGSALTLRGYRLGGGIASAIEQSAEDAFGRLDEPGKVAARRLMVRLAEPSGGDWVRRPVRRADLADDDASRSALSRLADARLVAVGVDHVDLTHEALLQHWPRLRTWLADRLLVADLTDHLSASARAWDAAGRADTDLYRGSRLQAALDWRADHDSELTATEAVFLDASAEAAERELAEANRRADREARGRKRLRAVVASLVAVVLLACAAAAAALRERSSADASARRAGAAALTADTRRLAALAANAPDIATSSLLAVASDRLEDTAEGRGALLSAVERNSGALWRFQTPNRPQRLAATADGRWLAYSDNRRSAVVVDTSTRRTVASFPLQAGYLEGITPDGRQLIAFGQGPGDADPVGRLSILDVATHARVHVLTTAIDPNGVEPVLSQDGRWLAARTTTGLSVWDSRDWSRPPSTLPIARPTTALAVSAHAVALEGPDASVTVRALPSLRLLGVVPAMSGTSSDALTPTLAVSPSGATVVRTDPSDQKQSTLFRLTPRHSGAPAAAVRLPGQPDLVDWAAFSPDGAQVAVVSESGSVATYSSADGSQVANLPGHSGPVRGVAWTGVGHPTGLYTAGLDSEIVSWSLSSRPRLVSLHGKQIAVPDRGELFGHWIFGLTPAMDGSRPSSREQLYLANLDTGSFSSWNAGLQDSTDGQNGDGEYPNQAVASWNGRWGLVSVNSQTGLNHIDVWDLTRHVRTGTLQLPGTAYRHFPLGLVAAISRDGRTAYAAIDHDHIGEFELPSGHLTRRFPAAFAGKDAGRVLVLPWEVAPDGSLLVAGYDPGPYRPGDPYTLPGSRVDPPDQRLGVLDPRTGHWLGQRHLGDHNPHTVAWSPDGRTLAVGTAEGTLATYDAHTLAQRADAGIVEPGYVLSLSYAPDGRTLVTGGTSGALNFYDTATLSRVGSRLQLGASSWLVGWYDASGDVVGFAPVAGRGREQPFTLRADRASLVATACRLAGADITHEQWRRYVGDRPFRSVCPR